MCVTMMLKTNIILQTIDCRLPARSDSGPILVRTALQTDIFRVITFLQGTLLLILNEGFNLLSAKGCFHFRLILLSVFTDHVTEPNDCVMLSLKSILKYNIRYTEVIQTESYFVPYTIVLLNVKDNLFMIMSINFTTCMYSIYNGQ
jgi:hypothetical protein